MMEAWKKIRLGNTCVTNANSYSSKEEWKFVNYLDTGNITDNIIDSIQYIDTKVEQLPSRARRKVKNGSIVYSTVRPNQRHFGIIKTQPENFLVSTGFAVIDVDADVLDADFLYYLLTQPTLIEALHAIAEQSTSAYPSIKPSDIENLEIMVPELATQKKIADILGGLDRKIAKNNAINDNLEQQAQALFSNYYDQSTTEVRFTDLIQVLGGGTPKTSEISYWNGKIPFFTPKDVGNPYTLNTEKSITETGLDHCNSRSFPVNTVFVTARGTVGKVALAGVPMAMNQSCYALVGKGIHPILVYFYTLKAVEHLKHKASGAVFDAIITKDFETENLKTLSDSAAEDFIVKTEPIYQLILNNTIENQRLGKLRDTLLPRLMSGNLDVSAIKL